MNLSNEVTTAAPVTSDASSSRASTSTPFGIVGVWGVAALAILAAAEGWWYRRWDFDDGYIVYRIVRNLIEGSGWSYNVGEAHNASTSVLNTVLIACGGWALGSIELASHLLATLWIFLAAVLAAALLTASAGRFIGILSGAATVVSLASNSTWGLEVYLFTFLLLLALFLETQGRQSYLLLGLLILARPDGIAFVGIKLAYDLARGRRITIRGLTTIALVLAPWVIFSLVEFHQIFPDTLSKKMWQGRSGLWGSGRIYLRALARTFVDGELHWLPVHLFSITESRVFAGAVTGLSALTALYGWINLVRRFPPLIILLVFAALQQTVYIVLNVPGYHWYFSLFYLLILLGVCGAVGALCRRVRACREAAPWFAAVPVLVYTVWIARQPPALDLRNEAYREAAKIMEARAPGKGAVAALEVGTLGYFTQRPILDLTALTSTNPEYVTGRNTDDFFRHPPRLVVLHDPPWHFERPVGDDLRFRMLYGTGEALPHPAFPLRFFVLTSEGEKLVDRIQDPRFVAEFAAEHYPPFTRETFAEGEYLRDSCILDLINGRLAAESSAQVQKTVLSLSGWAIDRARPGPPGRAFFVLRRSPAEGYLVPARRRARADVAAHLGDPRFTESGLEAEGNLVSMPSGEFSVEILQERAKGVSVLCETGRRIVVR